MTELSTPLSGITQVVHGVSLITLLSVTDLNTFADAADAAGMDLQGYSGRGMYGGETLSVRYEDDAELGDLMAELPKSMRRRVRTDQLGRSYVAYLQ